jgi:zinc finger protein DZIP1
MEIGGGGRGGGGQTFSFRRRWAQVDWRMLASIDVDRIAQTVDVQTLQAAILNITYCNTANEEFQNVDANFIKLFRLSQLIIEYLLFTQQYLTEQLQSLQEKIKATQKELETAQSKLSEHQHNLKAVKKENRKRRRMVESYQQAISMGGTHPCHVCRREFISADFLKGHMIRRHPLAVPPNKGGACEDNVEKLGTKLMEKFNAHLVETQAQMKHDLTLKETNILENKIKDFENWKRQEVEQIKMELDSYRQSIVSQLQEQNTEILKQTLSQAQAEIKLLKEKKVEKGRGVESQDAGKVYKKTQKDLMLLREEVESQVRSRDVSRDWYRPLAAPTDAGIFESAEFGMEKRNIEILSELRKPIERSNCSDVMMGAR